MRVSVYHALAVCLILFLSSQFTPPAQYYSHNDLRLHFGLGASPTAVQIEIRWPNNQSETIKDIAVNQIVTIKEGTGVVK